MKERTDGSLSPDTSEVLSITPVSKPRASVKSEDELSETGTEITQEDINAFFHKILETHDYATRSDNIKVFSYQDLTNENTPSQVVQGQLRCDEKEKGYNIVIEKNAQGQLSMRCSSSDKNALHQMISIQIQAMEKFGLERRLVLSGSEAAIKNMKEICDGFQPPIPYELDKGNADKTKKIENKDKDKPEDKDTSMLKFKI